MAHVRTWCGGRRSARGALIDDAFCAQWGRALLVLPSRGAATARRTALIQRARKGMWGNPVSDFRDLATSLLEADGVAVRRVGDAARHLILQGIVERLAQSPEFAHLAPLADGAGLARHLLEVINELKQAAIEPEVFRARIGEGAGATAMDALVVQAYTAYQDALVGSGRYDTPGLYWQAEAHCRNARPRAIAGVTAILFDGFDDFTPSEFRLIESLAAHVDTMIFGVPCDLSPHRSDLHAMALRTVARLRERLDAGAAECESPPAARCSEYAADYLFWRHEPPETAALEGDLKIVACADLQHEAEHIARAAKRLVLDEGLAPDAIAVVFPDLDAAEAPLRAAFAGCGVPLNVRRSVPLAQGGAGGMLLRLLEAWRAWAHDPVLDVLASPWLGETANAETFPLIARAATIVSGEQEWRNNLQHLRRRAAEGLGVDIAALGKRVPDAIGAIDAMLHRVDVLSGLEKIIPQKGSACAFASACDTLCAQLDAACAASGFERPALDSVRGLLADMAELPATGAPWTRPGFERKLAQALRDTAIPPPRIAGAVNALDPAGVRNLPFAHVFFGGLIEGHAPRPPASSAIYSDADRARMERAGVPLGGKREHLDRERAMFHHVLASGTRGVALSWRRLKDSGREASPSPFLSDVIAMFAAHGDVEENSGAASPGVPDPVDIFSERDLRNVVFMRGVEDAAARFPAHARRAAIELRRQSDAPFDAHDGVLGAPDLIVSLGTRFGAEHQFSVRRLEAYRECPFRFLQESVLAISETERPEAEFDPRVRGIILHEALETFHARFRGQSLAEIGEANAHTAMRAALDDCFARLARRSATAPGGVRAAEYRYLATMLDRYIAIALAVDDQGWKPRHFEVAFGNAPRENADPLCTEAPYVLESAAGPLRFSGRIDRIDEQGGALRIVDYKSGGVCAAKDIHEGRSLQLTVYAWALEQLLMPGARCEEAGFLPVGRRVGKGLYREALGRHAAREKERWAMREATALNAIAGAVTGIRAGQFPPLRTGDACMGCGTARACRFDAARAARKPGAASCLGGDDGG